MKHIKWTKPSLFFSHSGRERGLLRIFYLTFFILHLTFILPAQNLVPNYSFEDTIQSAQSFYEIGGYVKNWIGSGGGTSYFNSHSPTNPSSGPYYSVNVPQNGLGYQNAHTGEAYAGILTFIIGYTDGRGYLQDSLISPLIGGTKYYVSFYVSLADSEKYACNNIGAYFSNTPPILPPLGQQVHDTVSYTPQISNDSINHPLTDKVNWMQIKGSFVAAGGEQYIVIGNFVRDAHVDTIYVNSAAYPSSYDWNYAYYYIDDVIVSTDSTYADSLFTGVNEIKPVKASVKVYPNPASTLLNVAVNISQIKSGTICLYSATGKQVRCTDLLSNITSISISDLPSGMYYYRITDANGKLVKADKVTIIK